MCTRLVFLVSLVWAIGCAEAENDYSAPGGVTDAASSSHEGPNASTSAPASERSRGPWTGPSEPPSYTPPTLVPAHRNRLVDTAWLAEHLDDPELVVVDARRTDQYLEGHIPGAVSASFSPEAYRSRGRVVSYGGGLDIFGDFEADFPFAYGDIHHVEEAVRGLGIDNGSVVVIYDVGGTFHAAMVYFILEFYGHQHVHLLDGGFWKWENEERETSVEGRVPEPGDFQAWVPHPEWVVDTDYVLQSLHHPERTIVSSLLPTWHFGSHLAYSRPGHIPSTRSIPLGNFFRGDRTFRSPEEIRAFYEFSEIDLEGELIGYCGGGPLSLCGDFVLRHLLELPRVRNYQDALVAWLAHPAELPVNLHQHPEMLRNSWWIAWWAGDRMQTLLQDAPAIVLDVRAAADRAEGFIPWSVSLPLEEGPMIDWADDAWAEALGAIGVGTEVEVVVCDGGPTPRAMWMAWKLESLGHPQVSLCAEGHAGWEDAGFSLTTEEPLIASPEGPLDVAIHPKDFVVAPRERYRLAEPDGALVDDRFGRLWLVVADEDPEDAPGDDWVRLPPEAFVDEAGTLLPGDRMWEMLADAGVPYFREIVVTGPDRWESARAWFALRLMGYPAPRLLDE